MAGTVSAGVSKGIFRSLRIILVLFVLFPGWMIFPLPSAFGSVAEAADTVVLDAGDCAAAPANVGDAATPCVTNIAPEPATFLLLILGGLAILWRSRRRHRKVRK